MPSKLFKTGKDSDSKLKMSHPSQIKTSFRSLDCELNDNLHSDQDFDESNLLDDEINEREVIK